MSWPVKDSKKPDLIFFDPPYYKKMAAQYMKGSISDFSRSQYLNFFKKVFALLKKHSSKRIMPSKSPEKALAMPLMKTRLLRLAIFK